jgi:hypothetical protein
VDTVDTVDTVTEKADPSVWYHLYLKEREHRAKVCALAPGPALRNGK